MKLIIAGSTGLVATEIIRQSLQKPEITSIIALSRKPLQIQHENASKLKTVIVKDYEIYTDEVKAELRGADACIWTVAVTPLRSRNMDFAEVKRVCQTCALAGLNAIYDSGPARPFRCIYISAEGTPRDMSRKPMFMGDYQLMRGETETLLLALAAAHPDTQTQICIAEPGMITSTTTFPRMVQAYLFSCTNLFTRAIPNTAREELVAAMLKCVMKGIEKETLGEWGVGCYGTGSFEGGVRSERMDGWRGGGRGVKCGEMR